MPNTQTIPRPRVARKRTGFWFTKPDGSERRLKSKPHLKILDAAAGIYAVRSESNHDKWYIVDAVSGLCTCEAGHTTHGCWHRWLLSSYFQPVAPQPEMPEPIEMATWRPAGDVNPWKDNPQGLIELFEPTARRPRRALS